MQAPRVPVLRGRSGRSVWPFVSAFDALPVSMVDGLPSSASASEARRAAGEVESSGPDGNHGDNTSLAVPLRVEMLP